MGLTGNIVTPYPPALTDAQWKAAKTAAAGDKIKTELGGALRAAETAYNKIIFTQISLHEYEQHKPALNVILDVQHAKTGAQTHYNVTVKPAIKALQSAKTKADLAKINPAISSASRTKATQISAFLASLITTLKSFNTADYDARVTQLTHNYTLAKNAFDNAFKQALSGARQFVRDVKANPTVAVYNQDVMDAARDLTQCLGQVDRMQKSGFQVQGQAAWANAIVTKLTPRAQGHADLPANATPAAVLKAIKEFEKIVADVEEWAV